MIQAYRNLHKRGELKIRSFLLYNLLGKTTIQDAQQLVAKHSPWGDDVLTLGGVKCSFDGTGSGGTAWFYEEYYKDYPEKDVNFFGSPTVADPHLHGEVMKILHRAGFQIGAHCIGDITIDKYLDEIQAAIIDTPRTNCRHSVIHGNLQTNYALRKLGELGDNIVIEAYSGYIYSVGHRYYSKLGPSRCRRLIPLKTLFEQGVMVGNGVDYNVCPINPIYSIYAAITRQPEKHSMIPIPYPFGRDECLSIQQALQLNTINSAYCLFWEHIIGSLEPGKYADLVVWSDDFYTQNPDNLLNQKVELTMVGGEIVYIADKKVFTS